ncbi:hypothetical protein J8L85_07645 [Maribacter sp. MMG018]|uniref:hypothetical protein n=1 Tax=Maribacter sp. MMG018 TaxID=2822688 RepID=UPI001B398E05|nr:hypothetical protein [Maribacter sp. MMG018]MBQ4914303.1 hypothetical protein [Maribacter sp. MMG018]
MQKSLSTLTTAASISLAVLLLTSCNQPQKKEHHDDSPAPPEVEAPSNIISLKEANVIYDNYSKHRVNPIVQYETKERAPEKKFEPSRYVDFDYETIKQYIDYVEQEAKKAGVKKITKLRLYYANYPDQEKFPNGKKVIHKRQNSIFIVPTLEMQGTNYGFYIAGDGKAALIRDWKDDSKEGLGASHNKKQKAYAGFSLNSNLQTSKSLALNFGQSGPPPKTDF